MPLVQSADPGGEYLIPWSKLQVAKIHATMLRTGDPATHRTIYASDGAVIYLNVLYLGQGQFRDSIRITAQTGGWRGQYHSGSDNASAEVNAKGVSVEQRAFQYADWSADYKTFAYASGDDVVLDRGGITVTLTNATAPTARPGTTYWKAHNAAMSHDGKTALVVPKEGVEAPTVSKLAVIAKWTDPVGDTPGSWSTVDLPVPPVPLATSGWSGSATATEPTYGMSKFASSNSTGAIYIGSAPTQWSAGFSPRDGYARVFVNPYSMTKVYVAVQYWAVVASVVAIDPYTPSPPSYAGGVVHETQTPTQQVWSYTVADGAWKLEYTHDETAHVGGNYYYARGYDGIAWGSVDTYLDNVNLTAFTLGFSPQGGMHVIKFDNRVLPEATTTNAITGASAVHFYDAVTYDASTRDTSADVYMGDAVLLPSYTVSATVYDEFVYPEQSFAVLQLAQVNSLPRGALVQAAGYGGGASSATEWRHGDAVTDHVTMPMQTTAAPILFNKTMSRATGVDTGTSALRQKVYENGAQIWDGIDDMPTSDPNVVVTAMNIQWLSWARPTVVYARVDRDVTTPGSPGGDPVSILVYTGTASSATMGLTLDVNASNDDGFNAAGTVLYQTISTSGTSSPTTTADLNAAFGVSDWTFTLDGGSYTATYTSGATDPVTDSFTYHEIAEVTAAPAYTVKATLMNTIHVDALAADIPFNDTGTHDLIPDEAVI